MDVFQLPFNRFIGLQASDRQEYLMMLPTGEQYGNHLGTAHASALFALAEATGGLFLLREFEGVENVMPVVRNVGVKYKKPASGPVFSKAKLMSEKNAVLESLATKKRTLVSIQVTLHDVDGLLLVQSTFEWFVFVIDQEERS